jgi:putative addiction module component (TIGR02574 family)
MSRPLRNLTEEAPGLPEEDRLALAAELIDSVEGPADPDWERAWLAELDRRRLEADRTGDRGRPWDEIRNELQARSSTKG